MMDEIIYKEDKINDLSGEIRKRDSVEHLKKEEFQI
jgi:hypothetical protein